MIQTRLMAAAMLALGCVATLGRAGVQATTLACSRPPWIAEGDQTDCRFGTIAPAGDVNGDGYADVVIGSYNYSNGQANEGRIYVYLGGPGGLAAIPAWTFESDQAGAQLGDKLSGAGDVNGDGYDDLVVGAAGWDGAFVDEGKAYLFLGSPAGLSSAPAWTATGGQAGAAFGSCIRNAGDVNGDGYDDVIVGAWLFDTPLVNAGKAFLYLGGPAGLSSTPAWTNGGEASGAVYGYFVNEAGDLNGDGYGDIVVGSRRFSANGIKYEGKVYVYFGSPSGPSLDPGWTMTGGLKNGEFGAAVGGAGDVNRDGYDDLMVGAFRQSVPDSAEGRAYIYLGGPAGPASSPAWSAEGNQKNAMYGYHFGAGDINHDGYSDVVVSAVSFTVNDLTAAGRIYLYEGGPSGMSTVPAWTMDGDQAGQGLGDAVTVLGDIDRDGFEDFGVGALYRDNAFVDAGRAYAYYGCADSLTADFPGDARDGMDLTVAGANPVAGATIIRYSVPASREVDLRVVGITGRTVRTLAHGVAGAGVHVARWDGRAEDGRRVAAGVYLVRLTTGAATRVVKVTRLP